MYYIYLACKVTDCVTFAVVLLLGSAQHAQLEKFICITVFHGSTLALTQKCIFLYKK